MTRGSTGKARIALNGRFSGEEQPTGTHVSSYHLLDHVVRAPRDVDVVVFADPAAPGVAGWSEVPGTTLVPVPFRRWSRPRAQAWEQLVLPSAARRAGCAVVHHPMNTCPRRRGAVRHLVTLHDLNALHHPEWTGRAFGLLLRHVVLPAVRRADHVATVSDHVLRDVRRTLGLPADRTSRVHNGLTPLPAPLSTPRPRHATNPQRVLGVNLWQPHKNLPRLVEAVTALRAEGRDVELHLAGRPQANYRRDPALAGLVERPGVVVLGYLTDAELATAYATADVVAYPSLSEGFGLPVLEALAAGATVVTSSTTSLPEVAGGAAYLVDPARTDDLAAGLLAALDQTPAERAARAEAGRAVAAGFRWSAAAEQYLELYRRLL